MKRCSVAPYEGKSEYIFVSYCHKDRARVFPVIEQLRRDGFRVWYDEGIDPGSEWPEIIANHLNSCSVCIAFVSENSLSSHNCRREINFALLKKKFFISVILEPVRMSPGMEMQLSSSQSIFRYALEGDGEFFEKLYSAKELQQCFSSPDLSVNVHSQAYYEEDESRQANFRDPFNDRWFADNSAHYEKNMSVQIDDMNRTLSEAHLRKRSAEDSTTVAQLTENRVARHILRRIKTNETVEINKKGFVVGRSPQSADYVIEDNQSISRVHAVLSIINGVCCIKDNNSVNKTYVNGTELQPEVRYFLSDGDSIRFYNENFIYNKIY